RLVLPPGRRPVGELRQALQPARELHALLDRALEPLLADRHVEPGLAQRLRERAEGVPVERLGRHRAATVVEVLRRRRSAELLPQLAQQADELLARREAAWHEPGLALGGVPA